MSEYLDKITHNGTDYDLHDTGSREAIAPEYSDLVFPVSAGKFCWHEGILYRVKQAIPASESWTAAHWEEAVIGDDLAALSAAVTALQALPTDTVLYGTSQSLTEAQKTQARWNIGAAGEGDVAALKSAVDAISELDYVENLFDKSTATAQRVLDGDGGTPSISGAYNTSDYIPIAKGDKLYFYGESGYSYQWCHAYEVYDSSKNYITGAVGNSILPTGDSYVPITSDSAAYFRFSYTSSIEPAMYHVKYAGIIPYGSKVLLSAKIKEGVDVEWDSVKNVSVGLTDLDSSVSDVLESIDENVDTVLSCFDFTYLENLLNKTASTAQRVLDGQGGTPAISGAYDTSDYIAVKNGDKLYFYGESGYSYQLCVAYEIYDSSKNYISGATGNTILPTANSYIEVSNANAAYIRISYTSTIDTAVYPVQHTGIIPYGEKELLSADLDEDVGVEWASVKNADVKLADLDDEVIDAIEESKTVSGVKCAPVVHIEMDSYFWMRKMPTHFDQDTPFTVSGAKDATTLTVTGEQQPSILDSADSMSGVVILYDDDEQTCKPYIITGFTANTISVYPPIEKAITAGTLAPLMFDSQHLTKYGYMAWVQHINNSNPKHCEKNKYIARYCPISSYEAPPFTRLTGSPGFYEGNRNDTTWWHSYGSSGAFMIPYTNYSTTGEYGIEWEVDTGKNEGYLEAFIGTVYMSAITNESVVKDSGYEIHIEAYADGTKIFEKIKNTNYVERVCVDFTESQKNVKLKVYYTKMRSQTDTLSICSATFWVNENYPEAVLPKNAVVSEFCDSWGTFHNNDVYYADPGTVWWSSANWYEGASAKELKRIMSAKNGYQANVFNCSRGSMTSRWGKYWWYVASGRFNPNVMLTNFAINDYHTTISQGFENIPGPYGETIVMVDNPLTVSEYCANMSDIISMCVQSNVTPVIIGGCIGANIQWTLSLISSLAEELAE